MTNKNFSLVIPAKAGIYVNRRVWMPASAGMTSPKALFRVSLVAAFFICCSLLAFCHYCYAQDIVVSYDSLKETTDKCLAEKKYNECAEYLTALIGKDSRYPAEVNYFLALTRYSQLKYLEESQDWNEYFDKGSDYRQQVKSYAQVAIAAAAPQDKTNVYARLILWKLHKDQDDPAQEEALSALTSAALAAGDIGLLKDVADGLSVYGEKISSRRLYNAYVEKLSGSKISDEELKASAADFYQKKNMELSEALYDAYIGRIITSMPKERLVRELKELAGQFVYNPAVYTDIFYAEKVFEKLEQAVGKGAFDEETLYSRAFNLEKTKEFVKAKDIYSELLSRFPEAGRVNEALYKTGMIDIYALRNLKEGRSNFEKLAAKEVIDPQVISGFYQLGLLSQWEGDVTRATQYYDKLLEIAKDGYMEKTSLAKTRLKEISETKPLDYNLKLSLDVALKQENSVFDAGKVELKLSPYIIGTGESLNVVTTASAGDSGCMPIGLQYLWSGDLGSASPTPEQYAFETTYSDSGTKGISLVVVSPAGVVGRSFDIADAR